MLAVCLCAAGARAALTVRHEAVNGAYLPGRTLAVSLVVEEDAGGPLNALALVEALPAGWTFLYFTDTPIPPDVSVSPLGVLINFVTVPEPPFTATFLVDVPATASGPQTLTVSGLYRGQGEEQALPERVDMLSEGVFGLEVGVRGPGTVLPKAGTIPFIEPDGIILEAVPADEDHVFFRWEGLNSSRANPLPLVVDGPGSITAVFAPLRRISVAVQGEGTVTPGPGEYRFPEGEVLYLEAAAAAGWRFDHWEGLNTGSEAGIVETVAGNGYFLAVFVEETAEGEGEGDGEPAPEFSSGDTNEDNVITLSELLRAVQFFNIGGYQCANRDTEDGYITGTGETACPPHTLDYQPQDWQISLSELLRFIQFYNSGGYYACEGTEDGFCPGMGAGL